MVAHAFVHDSGVHSKVFLSVPPQDASGTDIEGDGLDRRLYYSGKLVVVTGAAEGSPSSYSVTAKLQHSDESGAGFEDIAGLEAASVAEDNGIGEADVQISELKQYLRVVVESEFDGGSSPSVPVTAFFVGAAGQHLPSGLDVTTTSVNVNQ